MSDEHDYDVTAGDDSDDAPSGLRRFIPMLVVTMAISGFVGLAWYAYHAGSNSISEEDLLLIEADRSPLKETPADPGGMKFPHQDKTIFQAFSGRGEESAQVERVLPPPEEPMDKPAGDAQTRTWVNEKLRRASERIEPEEPAKSETSAAADKEESTPAAPVEAPSAAASAAPVTPVEVDRSARQERAEKPAPAAAPAPPPEAKKEEVKEAKKPEAKKTEAKKEEPKPEPKKEAKAEAKKGAAKIQLGAYKSEAEAKAEWSKIVRKNAAALDDVQPTVVKADLGEKGVFYRLQVHGLAAAAAKEICGKLQAGGQACIVPQSK